MTSLAHDMFLLFGQLFQLKSKEKVRSLFLESLKGIRPGFSVSEIRDDKHSWKTEVRTAENVYAPIFLNIPPYEISHEFHQVFSNSVQMLAVILEKLDYESLLDNTAREKEKKYRKYIDSSPVALFVVDETGDYVEVNRSACNLLGYTNRNLRRLNIRDISDCKNLSFFDHLKKSSYDRHETKLKHRDGHEVDVDLVAVKLSEDRYMAFCIDITDKKQLEHQLYQSQKLDSIGKLAAGIAHDFNNLLTVIMGNASLLKRKLTTQGFVLEVVDDIISASNKAAELTRKMLLFSRKEPMDFIPVQLNDILLDLMKILTRLIGENIQIHTDLTENLKIIEADKSNIEQVILNVVSNAKDAMPEGGNITLSTKNFIVDNYNKPTIPNSEIGEYVSLVIEDDGCGIEDKILDKIFDPFFTTKEVGKGTGLGLSVVYGIVKKHGGWINIYSEKQIGTSIKIYLPVHSVDSDPEIAEQMNKDFDIDDRDEAILMVEDNGALLKLGVHLLEDYGFIVDFAETAKEAEEIFEKHNCDYDMVISDIVLPDCNGVDLVDKMRKKNPDIRVLFISGYANENLILKIKNSRDMHFLAKPFDHSKLVETIVSIFDE